VSADTAGQRAPEEVLDAVGEDSDLAPVDKEITISYSKDEDTARVFSAVAGVSRRLLAHPHVDVIEVRLVDEDTGTKRHAPPDDVGPSETVVGVRASVDVGLLGISGSPRTSGGPADLVTERVMRHRNGGDSA
jgi:hypothetical protein